MGIKLSSIKDPALRARIMAADPITAEAHNASQIGHYKFHPQPKAPDRYRPPTRMDAKLIRQEKPVQEGQWEKEWREQVEASGEFTHVKAQSLRVRLANGSWYRPDVSAMRTRNNIIHCWDVKGGSKMKGTAKGRLAIKVAASLYKEFRWALAWKKNGEWMTQEVIA